MISKFIKALLVLATLSLAGCFSNGAPEDIIKWGVDLQETQGYSKYHIDSLKVDNSYETVANSENVENYEYTAEYEYPGDTSVYPGQAHIYKYATISGKIGLVKRGKKWYIADSQPHLKVNYHD